MNLQLRLVGVIIIISILGMGYMAIPENHLTILTMIPLTFVAISLGLPLMAPEIITGTKSNIGNVASVGQIGFFFLLFGFLSLISLFISLLSFKNEYVWTAIIFSGAFGLGSVFLSRASNHILETNFPETNKITSLVSIVNSLAEVMAIVPNADKDKISELIESLKYCGNDVAGVDISENKSLIQIVKNELTEAYKAGDGERVTSALEKFKFELERRENALKYFRSKH